METKPLAELIDQIHLGKWEKIMPQIPSNSVDIVITSPPYNIAMAYEEHSDNMPYDKYLDWMNDFFYEVNRVLKTGGRFCLNCADAANGIIPIHADFSYLIRKVGVWKYKQQNPDIVPFQTLTTIVWDKLQIGNACSWGSFKSPAQPSFPTQFEFILVFGKGSTRHEGNKEKITVSSSDFIKNSRALWKFHPESQSLKVYEHPCAFPEELPRRLIDQLTYLDDVVLDPFSGCYDEDTEVLTKSGWRYFKDVCLTDEFITRASNGEIEYQTPLQYHKYCYKGSLTRIFSRSTDLLVTDNHNMYVLTHADFCAKRNPRFVKACKMKNNLYKIPCGGKYTSTNNILSKAAMHLIGLYLSEGYFEKQRKKRSSSMIICQNKGVKNNKMKDDILPFISKVRSSRKFSVKLEEKFRDFIIENCGQGKYNKFISPLILSNEHLDALFESMMDGDGCRWKCGFYNGKQYFGNTYYTSSKKLADCFQELCVKLGYESRSSFRKRGGEICGRKIKNPLGCYSINIRKSKNKTIYPKRHFSKVNYNGFVYCVTVPNHTLYVRRGGTTSWCGNSGTTCAVAKAMGRHYIGIEMTKKYYDKSLERVASIPETALVKIGEEEVSIPVWLT